MELTKEAELTARAFLAEMTTQELQKALEAFPRTPMPFRFPMSKCFLGCAFRDDRFASPYSIVYPYIAGLGRGLKRPFVALLEQLYEHGADEWLHGEVLRELAERGAVPELAAVEINA